MGFGAVGAQAVQEHQLRSIVPSARGTSTLPPHDPEHILVHHSARHTEPLDSDDWLKRTNARTQLSKAFAENKDTYFRMLVAAQVHYLRRQIKGTPDLTKTRNFTPSMGSSMLHPRC